MPLMVPKKAFEETWIAGLSVDSPWTRLRFSGPGSLGFNCRGFCRAKIFAAARETSSRSGALGFGTS